MKTAIQTEPWSAADRKLAERVRRKFRAGVREFRLLEPGEGVLVGLSGGKDSMALLQLLGEFRRHASVKFPIVALHVRMRGVDYRTDTGYLADFAAQCGAELRVEEATFPEDRNEKRTPCFLCAWTRRKILFRRAQEWGFGKIALGHHHDDILTTALMNLTFNGSFSTMPVLQAFRKMPLAIIRPLCLVSEADLKRWAELFAYQPLIKVCPNDDVTHRAGMKKVLEDLRRVNAEADGSLWHALYKAEKLVEK